MLLQILLVGQVRLNTVQRVFRQEYMVENHVCRADIARRGLLSERNDLITQF